MESIESLDKEISMTAPNEKQDVDMLEDIKNSLMTITNTISDITEKLGALKESESSEEHEDEPETAEPEEPDGKEDE